MLYVKVNISLTCPHDRLLVPTQGGDVSHIKQIYQNEL